MSTRGLLLAALLAPACLGAIEGEGAEAPRAAPPGPPAADPASPGASAGPAAERPMSAAPSCARAEVAPGSMRRLTRAQYDRAVRDLLGVTASPAGAFLPDERVGAFAANATAPPSEVAVEDYQRAAEQLAAAARLDAVLPCRPVTAAEEEPCARRFVEGFGLRAFRRPLAADESARYLALYAQRRTRGDFASGVRIVIEAMLQSPHFLYLVEPAAAGVAPLDPYALAARLAFLLLGSVPDAALLRAAAEGRLATVAGLEAEARRLLASEAARATWRRFHREWFGLDQLAQVDKDPRRFPEFTAAVRIALLEDAESLVDRVVAGGGRIDDLLLAPLELGAPPVAAVYGRAPDPRHRSGLLTHPALLAVVEGVVQRGRFVRERLLCQEVPPPPDDLDTELPMVDENAPIRERFAVHQRDPACGGCHRLLDPLGFAFLNYDEIGRRRESDRGRAIDASGELVAVPGAEGTFEGAVGLARLLAGSTSLHSCAVTQWFRYAFGRDPAEADACTLDSVGAALAGSAGDVRHLLLALVRSDAFRFVRGRP